MKKRHILAGIPLLFISIFLNSQTVINPNYSLKSHETLNIVKIELKPEATIFYMSIENRIEGGSFCADKNIFIVSGDGKKIKIGSVSGIPVCPESYKFKTPGEKLDFVLVFPALRKDVEWIDLIEECSDNCFSFYGINLDINLNKRIDDAFLLAENDELMKAMVSFISIAEDIDKENNGIEAMVYINIIRLAIETGDDQRAREWYKKFRLSEAPRLADHIKYLNDQGIKY